MRNSWLKQNKRFVVSVLRSMSKAATLVPSPPLYVIRLLVRCNDRVKLPPVTNAPRLMPILFTQGINEKQTLANTTHASTRMLQETINEASLTHLNLLMPRYMVYLDQASSAFVRRMCVSPDLLQAQLVALTEMVERNRAGRKKHPEILQLSSDLTRLMDAGRVTCCKSAKDRSSMSITLEHGRLLVTNHRLPPLLMPEVVSTMRSAGVRLDNTFKNTGKRKFAFNALQRSLLPEAYRCPPQAGGNNKS